MRALVLPPFFSLGVPTSASPASFDAATNAWVAAVIANGGTVSDARKTIVDALIVGLKADGLFSKLDRLWLFAAENAPSALTDIIADSLATTSGSPAFAVDRGYTAGTSKWIDSNYNPATAGTNYVQNSASLFVWEVTGGLDSGAKLGTLNTVGTGGESIFVGFTGASNGTFLRVNDSPETGQISTTNTAGLYFGNRSGATSREAYYNGSSLGTYGSSNSKAPISENITFLNWPPLGVQFTLWSTHQLAAGGAGGSFSSTDATNFYNRMRTYMTAVGN